MNSSFFFPIASVHLPHLGFLLVWDSLAGSGILLVVSIYIIFREHCLTEC